MNTARSDTKALVLPKRKEKNAGPLVYVFTFHLFNLLFFILILIELILTFGLCVYMPKLLMEFVVL